MSTSELSGEQRDQLSFILDQIIPASADGTRPGAGGLGLAAAIEQSMSGDAMLAATITQGLEALGTITDKPRDLDDTARTKLVKDLNEAAPALIPTLTFHTYTAYYQHGRVLEALGLEARPPHPIGYEMSPLDESLLEPVRARDKMYREV